MKAEPHYFLPLLISSVLFLIHATSVVGLIRVLPLSTEPRSPWKLHQQSKNEIGVLRERPWRKYQKSGPKFGHTRSSFPSRILPCKATADDDRSEQSPETIFFSGRLIGSLSEEELPDLIELLESIPVADQCFVRLDHDDKELKGAKDPIQIQLPAEKLPHGATGRAVVIELSLSLEDIGKAIGDALTLGAEETPDVEDVSCILEGWKATISQYIDEILYSDEDNRCFQQPILFSVVSQTPTSTKSNTLDSDGYYRDQLLAMIQEQVRDFGLVDDMENHHEIVEIPATDPTMFIPSCWYEVDGAMVTEGKQETVWDTSTVLVFDNLLESASEERNLRQRMRDVVLGNTSDDEEQGKSKQQRWDDADNGPDPSRWEAGGLLDLPGTDDDPSDPDIPESYGLTDDALEEICEENPPPTVFQEFESILSRLFPDFVVTRLPEAVLGGGVTPLTANAPCFGQSFDYHIDADPYSAPPSPWTDVYGRYANRATGKPRFISCLIYVNDEWDGSQWGAPTRFLDVATDTEVDIIAKPGRVVLMDQDITHTVVAPLEAAGKRPRYSLVWKLILHPKRRDQNMRDLCGSHKGWPDPLLVGSAKR